MGLASLLYFIVILGIILGILFLIFLVVFGVFLCISFFPRKNRKIASKVANILLFLLGIAISLGGLTGIFYCVRGLISFINA